MNRFYYIFSVCLVLILIFTIACDTDSNESNSDASQAVLPNFNMNDPGYQSDYEYAYASVSPFWSPEQVGPYKVGVYTTYVVDEDRFEIWGLRDRVLPIEIWYPTTAESGQINTVQDMVGDVPDWGWDVFELIYGDYVAELMATTTSAIRNAPIKFRAQPYPVIIFSHGISAIRFQNYTLCEHLASHGFIVVAPDHYGNAIFVNAPDGRIILFNPLTFVTSVFDRNQDVELIYEKLVEINEDFNTPFNQLMDLDNVGLSGHSYGGLTSMSAGPILDQIKAIAPLNPGWFIGGFNHFNKPFFLLQSEDDRVVPWANGPAKEAFDNSPTTKKVYINLLNAGHYNATDACILLPPSMISPATGCDGSQLDPVLANTISAGYMTSFFKSVLYGDERYDEYLMENHFPLDIEFEYEWQ